jgi:hypothetical protein
MAVKEKNPKKPSDIKPEDCPTSHHVRVGPRGSHKGLSDAQAKKKELSAEGERARRAASDAELATLKANAAEIEKFKGFIKKAADAADVGRVDYMRGELRKARARAPSAEDAVKEKEFERKVQENAKWSNVEWHCTDCELSGEIDAVMNDGTVKEIKSNGKPDRKQWRQRYLVGVPAIFGKVPIHMAVPTGMHADAKQSMADTRDQQFAETVVQEH